MVCLIDYDNLLSPHQRLGLRLLVERIAERVSQTGTAVGPRAHVRLYGGWYEGNSLSRKAQSLAAELRRDFPTVFRLTAGNVPVSAELALSLDIDPSTHLYHTLRWQPPPDVRCKDPRSAGCTDPSCPLFVVHDFLSRRRCPKSGCTIEPRGLLYRVGQKLVDSMLIADIFSVLRRTSEPIVVVSSDDDLWPGIQSIVSLGVQAVHVHTKNGAIARNPYSRPGATGYIAIELV